MWSSAPSPSTPCCAPIPGGPSPNFWGAEPGVPPRHSSCCSEAEHPQQQEARAEAGLSYFCPAQARGFPETSVGAKLRQGEGQSCPRTLGRGQMAPRGQLGLEMKEKQEEEERDTRAGCSLTSS